MPARFTKDELVEEAKAHYRATHWTVPNTLSAADASLAAQLSLRPSFIAKKDGMEHLVYVSGRITQATFNLQKQVLFEIAQNGVCYHVVLVAEERVTRTVENQLRAMGLGVLLIRRDAAPLELVDPSLQCFRPPSTWDRVPTRYRRAVKEAIGKVQTGDVCVGVMDIAQVLETALAHRGITVNTLGAKIKQAVTQQILRGMAANAADRVNQPRILRAHPTNHGGRRKKIVLRVQEIVDDCLALLFSLD